MPWNPAMMRQDVARFLGIQPEEVILFCRECWPSVRSTTVDTLALINRVYPRKL